jgi:hypothetical protein
MPCGKLSLSCGKRGIDLWKGCGKAVETVGKNLAIAKNCKNSKIYPNSTYFFILKSAFPHQSGPAWTILSQPYEADLIHRTV